MKKYSKIVFFIFVELCLVSCKNKDSIQKYLVDSQNRNDFSTFDISPNMLQLKDRVSKETEEIFKSIKKVNVAFLKIDDSKKVYETEKARLKAILKNPIYKSIIKISDSGIKLTIYYTGNKDQINELIAFGYGTNFGVGVARVLGSNMKPAEIIRAIKDVKFDKNGELFKKLENIF